MEVIGDYMEATTVDGKIYGFPTIRDMASAYGLILRNDIIEKYGIDADAGLTVEQLDRPVPNPSGLPWYHPAHHMF